MRRTAARTAGTYPIFYRPATSGPLYSHRRRGEEPRDLEVFFADGVWYGRRYYVTESPRYTGPTATAWWPTAYYGEEPPRGFEHDPYHRARKPINPLKGIDI